MTLEVEIRIGGTLIACANIANVSNLADTSDYEVRASTILGISRADPVTHHDGVYVEGHLRKQSVWVLTSWRFFPVVFAPLFEPFERRDPLPHGLDHGDFFAERPRGDLSASFGLALKNVGYVGIVWRVLHARYNSKGRRFCDGLKSQGIAEFILQIAVL